MTLWKPAHCETRERIIQMNDRRASNEATAALRHNLCNFPAMFAKSISIGTADEFHNATVTLVELGAGPLAITCAHVIADYYEKWKAGTALIRIGNVSVSPSQLAGLDTDVDLATIRLSDEQAADLVSEDGLTVQFYQPGARWPKSATTGESVAIGGFPGQWRQRRPDTRELLLGYYGIGATSVTTAHDRHFCCQFEREHWIWMQRNTDLPDLTMLGGLSGGPVFADRHLHRALVGIVTEIGEKGCDIMFISHVHWIQTDGSICQDRPWR
jgi:hypothetical protein